MSGKNLKEGLLFKPGLASSEKLQILEERDRLLRIRRESQSEKILNVDSSFNGTCPDMCPEKERYFRETSRMTSIYEDGADGVMDHTLAVKQYARSSADQEKPLQHELRPEPVLTMTMAYLVSFIMVKIDESEENLSDWYDFCWDRLRAVRKDIIQQQLCDLSTVTIVEQCARFHIACSDRFWGAKRKIFDEKINSENLMNCLQSLMHMYEDLRKRGITCPNEAEFNLCMVLLKLNSGDLLWEYNGFPQSIQSSVEMLDAIRLHYVFSNNMYSEFFKFVRNTTYLNACLLQRYFTQVRERALQILIKAYCPPNKHGVLPVSQVIETLKFDSSRDAIAFCEAYGLRLGEDRHIFEISRRAFHRPNTHFQIKQSSMLVTAKRIPLPVAVMGNKTLVPLILGHVVHSSFNIDGFLNEESLDASDQEEKMLRDVVQRQLSNKEILSSLSQDISMDSSEIYSTVNEDMSEEGNYEMNSSEEMSSDMNYEDDSGDYDNNEVKEESNRINILDEDKKVEDIFLKDERHKEETRKAPHFAFPGFPIPSLKSLNYSGSLNSSILLSPTSTKSVSKTLSPKFKFVYSPQNENEPQHTIPILSFSDTLKKESPKKSPVSSKKTKLDSPPSSDMKICKAPEKELDASLQIKNEHDLSNKLTANHDPVLLKLRTKLSEKMKKVSARKFGRIWREKVKKIQYLRRTEVGLGLPFLNDCSIEINRNRLLSEKSKKFAVPLLQRINMKIKSNIKVKAILQHRGNDVTDIYSGNLGERISKVIAAESLKHSLNNDISLQPIFWKIVFALPKNLPGCTFPQKLQDWIKRDFSSKSSFNGKIFKWPTESGVPVYLFPCVIEGEEELAKARNLSALVLIRAPGWDSLSKSSKFLSNLLSKRNHPIPVAVLTLGDKIEYINMESETTQMTIFIQSLWQESSTIVWIFDKLASNAYYSGVKVGTFQLVVEKSMEKFFDYLHEDSYLSEGLSEALNEFNNVITLYCKFLRQIETHIVECSSSNLHGAALEMKHFIKDNEIPLPDYPYGKEFLENVASAFSLLKLQNLKWPPSSSKELYVTLKEYCISVKCPQILSKLIRIIKPPDDEDPCGNLGERLRKVDWCHIAELIAQSTISNSLFQFNITYSKQQINQMLDTHWWMYEPEVIGSKNFYP